MSTLNALQPKPQVLKASVLQTDPPALKYERIRPISKFAPQRQEMDYGVIKFNQQYMSEEDYASLDALTTDLFNAIPNLVHDFAMLNLYFPGDANGKKLLDYIHLCNVCRASNVRFGYDLMGNWTFLPMHVSIFERVFESQNVLLFNFYPQRHNGVWNLDHELVSQIAHKGHCTVSRPPTRGLWIVEPWLNVKAV